MAFKDLMARVEKPHTERGGTATDPAIPGHRTVSPTTCIDGATEFSGKLRCKETLRIDGRLKGELYCDKSVIVGQSAQLKASIQADSVLVSGEVNGDIVARRKITLEKSARVTGDLRTPGIVIEEGAKLEGRILIAPNEQSAEKRSSSRAAAKTGASAGPHATPAEGARQVAP